MRLRRSVYSIVIVLTVLLSAVGRALSAVACTITPITGGYGTVNVLAGTAVDSTASISVSCSGGSASQAVRLCLNIGAGATVLGPSNERVMRSANDYIDHEFYFNSARTQVWGSWGTGAATAYPVASPAGIQSDVTLNTSGAGTFNYTVYARILAGAGQQDTRPGSYSWTASSPTVQYRALSGATACPTGGSFSDSGASSFTATVNNSCTVSATNVDFGSAGILSANIDASGTVTVQCTNTTPYNVGLNAGTGSGATVTTRKMTSGANTISYSLYQNSSRTTVWGNTVGTNTVSGTGSGLGQALTVYGRVPPQTTPAPGTYTDTIVATVTY